MNIISNFTMKIFNQRRNIWAIKKVLLHKLIQWEAEFQITIII